MAFTPISNTVPQYEENGVAASGYFIKFYESGTTTPTAMATDSTGTTLLDKCELNTEGYPINGSSAVFIPHIDKKYKIALFRNAADADANDLASAAWPAVDGLFPAVTSETTYVEGIDSVSDIEGFVAKLDNQQINLKGWHPASDTGGGNLYWDSTKPKSEHNGGTIFSPTVPFSATTGDYLNGAGETDGAGSGCWVRLTPEAYIVEMFGAVGDGVTYDDSSYEALMSTVENGENLSDSVYALENTFVIPQGKVFKNNGQLLRPASSLNNTPVVHVKGNYTKFSGGWVKSDKASPDGVVVLGQRDIASTYSALWWKFTDCTVEGVQASGNIAINIPSSQPYNGSQVNYFGTVSDILVRKCDVGVELTEISNGHYFSNIDFFFMIDSCYRLYGAYGNTISGGFCHSATNGVTVLKLLDERGAYAHNSENNHITGFHGEPGGAASRGYLIESGCSKNHLEVNMNVGGGNSVLNDDNIILNPWSNQEHMKTKENRFGDISAYNLSMTGNITKAFSKELGSNGVANENTMLDLFSVALDANSSCTVEIDLVARNAALGRYEAVGKKFILERAAGAITATEVYGSAVGTALTGTAWSAANPSVFSMTTFNNGTATTTLYNYEIRVKGLNSPPTTVVIN